MGRPTPANSRRQIFYSDPVVLADVQVLPEATWNFDPFLVMTPDSRLRAKVTVLWSPYPDFVGVDLTTAGNTIYLEEVEQDYGGPFAGLIPCTAIEGTSTAPTAITQGDLSGYSREFVTAGDAIRGFVQLGVVVPWNGQIVLQARWQPDGQRLPADEWEEITRFCSIVAAQVKL